MESLDLIAKWWVYSKVFETILGLICLPFVIYLCIKKWKQL